jgi:hypothetical protein
MRLSLCILVTAILLTLTSAISCAGEADLCLCREEISITLDADEVVLESLYCFENHDTEPREQKMYYEFPLDSVHLFPDTISVAFGFMDHEYETTEKGITFTVGMPGESCASVRINYTQTCLEPSFCYTPKTITGWNEPIEEADFEIRVPSGLELVWVSYTMHEVAEEGGMEVHKFTCKNCLPSEDLCLKWKSR